MGPMYLLEATHLTFNMYLYMRSTINLLKLEYKKSVLHVRGATYYSYFPVVSYFCLLHQTIIFLIP